MPRVLSERKKVEKKEQRRCQERRGASLRKKEGRSEQNLRKKEGNRCQEQRKKESFSQKERRSRISERKRKKRSALKKEARFLFLNKEGAKNKVGSLVQVAKTDKKKVPREEEGREGDRAAKRSGKSTLPAWDVVSQRIDLDCSDSSTFDSLCSYGEVP